MREVVGLEIFLTKIAVCMLDRDDLFQFFADISSGGIEVDPGIFQQPARGATVTSQPALRARILVTTIATAALILAVRATAVSGEDRSVHETRATFRDCSDCPEMVVIPAGTFMMGASPDEMTRHIQWGAFEASDARRALAYMLPQHSVTIDRSFAMGKYPLTRGEFAVFARETGYSAASGCTIFANHHYPYASSAGWSDPRFPQSDRDPVVCVSWQDTKAYLDWLNSKVQGAARGNGPYFLPSEAEWEYAARAGQQSARWWGDSIGANNADCDGCGSAWDAKRTAPVGSFRANPFGLFDMLGNVWQWTEDCWNASYENAPGDGTAWKSGDCGSHAMRGGDWSSSSWILRSALRTKPGTSKRTNYIGFRVARLLP